MNQKLYEVGDRRSLKGCFTEEYFLRGLSVNEIGKELGLPPHMLSNGIFISFALQLPTFDNFELGGWAKYSTDNFINYRKGKMKWIESKFESTYKDKRVPIPIDQAKKAWVENMKKEKLIKILPNIPNNQSDIYPAGRFASQIIVINPIECQITNYLKNNEIFRGVW